MTEGHGARIVRAAREANSSSCSVALRLPSFCSV
jgi:hypothetical protein